MTNLRMRSWKLFVLKLDFIVSLKMYPIPKHILSNQLDLSNYVYIEAPFLNLHLCEILDQIKVSCQGQIFQRL